MAQNMLVFSFLAAIAAALEPCLLQDSAFNLRSGAINVRGSEG